MGKGDLMNIISVLTSKAKKNMHLQITLTNGNTICGNIIDIDDTSVLILDKEKLAATSLNMVGAWQLDLNQELDIATPEEVNFVPDEKDVEYLDNIENIEEIDEIDVASLLDGFDPNSVIFSNIIPNKHVTKLPESFLEIECSSDRGKWDSIFSRYQNALKNNDQELFESLSDELMTMGDRNPKYGIFYYNSACFKLKSYDYPAAGKLFERAFRIDKKSDYIYNGAYTYLLEGNNPKALVNLGAYFCMEYPLTDKNMWYKFCDLAKDTKDYYIFSIALNEALSKYYQLEEENIDPLKFLIQSALYVFKDAKAILDMIADLLTSIENNGEAPSYEMIEHFIDDLNDSMDENGLSNTNDDFDLVFGILNGLCAEDETEFVHVPEIKVNDDIPVIERYTTGLKKGYVYRVIPPYRYGFLKDDDGINYHFKYDVVFDDVGFLDSTTEYNQLPLLFKSIPSTLEDASTDETAQVIFSLKLLDNMINLAKNFSKEREYPHAIVELDNVLDYDPDNLEAKNLKTRWEGLYEKKNRVESDKINFQPKNELEWKQKGNLLLKLGMYEESIDAFNKAFTNMSNSSSSLHGQGIAYLKTKRYEEAIVCFDKALEMNSLHYHANHARGIVYQRQGDYVHALTDFNKVINIRPDHKDAWKQKAFSHSQLKQYEKAIDAYNMALDLDPEDWVTLSNKSAVLIKQDKLFDAMKCIDKVLSYLPEHADSLFTKGYIFQKENRLEDALEYIERSLEYDPNNVKALSKKAFVLARMGKPEIAIDVMKNALKLNMGNAKTWYYKGVVHHYAGDYEKAIEAYQESLYIDPGVARVMGCKERAEKELEPFMESIQGASDSLEHEENLSSNEGVEDLISKLNGKFSTS